MDIKQIYSIVESALEHLSLNPTEARCADPGQWLLFREEHEIYVDIWTPEANNHWSYLEGAEHVPVFQVIAPLFFLPEEKLQLLYEEMLQINFNLMFGALMINRQENMVAIRFRRPAGQLRSQDVVDAIESVGYYAEMLGKALKNKYQGKDLPQS